MSEALHSTDEQHGAEGSWGPTVRGLQHHSLPPPGVLGPSSSCGSPDGGHQLPGLGGAAGWYCALRGLMLVFQLHSHLSLLLVSGTQGREASILIFISGIGLCLLCRCLAPPHLSPCASVPLAVQRSPDPTEGQGCPPACKPFPSTGGDDSLPPCVVCPVLPCWGQGLSWEGGQRRWSWWMGASTDPCQCRAAWAQGQQSHSSRCSAHPQPDQPLFPLQP